MKLSDVFLSSSLFQQLQPDDTKCCKHLQQMQQNPTDEAHLSLWPIHRVGPWFTSNITPCRLQFWFIMEAQDMGGAVQEKDRPQAPCHSEGDC